MSPQKTAAEEFSDQIEFLAWAFSFFAPALVCSVKRAVVGEPKEKKK